jgi:hypothetical protein
MDTLMHRVLQLEVISKLIITHPVDYLHILLHVSLCIHTHWHFHMVVLRLIHNDIEFYIYSSTIIFPKL